MGLSWTLLSGNRGSLLNFHFDDWRVKNGTIVIHSLPCGEPFLVMYVLWYVLWTSAVNTVVFTSVFTFLQWILIVSHLLTWRAVVSLLSLSMLCGRTFTAPRCLHGRSTCTMARHAALVLVGYFLPTVLCIQYPISSQSTAQVDRVKLIYRPTGWTQHPSHSGATPYHYRVSCTPMFLHQQ